MKSLTFTIPGRPVPWARAGRGKNGHSFTPKKQADHARQVRAAWAMAVGDGTGVCLFDTPVVATIDFCYPFPKGDRRTWHLAPRPGRPDLDNLVKQILDALNGFAFTDDALVVRIAATKQYNRGGPARTVVTISEVRYP